MWRGVWGPFQPERGRGGPTGVQGETRHHSHPATQPTQLRRNSPDKADRQCKGSTEQRVLHVREHQGVSREASWKRRCEEEPWRSREVELERWDAPSPGIVD